MFTGIIEEVGRVKNIKMGASSAIITIQADKVMEDIHLGDSIAMNGVCLTVDDQKFSLKPEDVQTFFEKEVLPRA